MTIFLLACVQQIYKLNKKGAGPICLAAEDSGQIKVIFRQVKNMIFRSLSFFYVQPISVNPLIFIVFLRFKSY
jgi:hypothetical protein